MPYQYDKPASVAEKTFTERSKNYLKHNGNHSSTIGFIPTDTLCPLDNSFSINLNLLSIVGAPVS